jgi:predicted nucleotidyltransferase
MPAPQLTAGQLEAIIKWAKARSCIAEVRLFGSRAKMAARPNSDIDLALTITADETGDPLSIYLCERQEWEQELTRLLGLVADLEHYDPKGAPLVFAYCQEASIRIYPPPDCR